MKIKDSIIGFAIGDAIGVPIEFQRRENLVLNPIKEMIGDGSYNMPKGTWSDDTSMVLATIDSIINCKVINYNDIADRFCLWINEGKYTATDFAFDIGNTTRSALKRYMENQDNAIYCGGKEIYDNGNGSLMRILPLIYYFFYKNIDDDDMVQIIRNVSSITHAHEISILGCYIYTQFIFNILNGCDIEKSYLKLQKEDYNQYFQLETIELYNKILSQDIRDIALEEIKSSGYVIDTLEAVLWTILNTNNYRESIIKAINLGGDTDTIGALVGGIAGLYYGYETIPEKWLKDLLKLDYLIEISTQFENYLKSDL